MNGGDGKDLHRLPQIMFNGFIKAGITGALDGHMDIQDEPENDDKDEINSNENGSNQDDIGDEVDLTTSQ